MSTAIERAVGRPVSSGTQSRAGRFLRENSLTLVTFFVLFVGSLVGQGLTGYRVYNEEQRQHGEAGVGLGEYLRTGHFGQATFENWQSEFLQMGAYVLLTVWFRQRGSAESKKVEGSEAVDEDPNLHRHDPHAPWPVRRGGLVLALYKNSLAIAFLFLFTASWALHASTGVDEFNSGQRVHGHPPVSTVEYAMTSQFWFETFQNWQSEFLAVAAIVFFTVYLRQQGSPESKPVHAPHWEKTGTD